MSAPTRATWRPSPYVILVIGLMAVSTASLFIRFAQTGGAPSLVIAALRLSLASLILTPFTLRQHWPALRSLSRRELGLALLSGVFLAIHFASWITSLEHVSVLVSVVLVTTNPLWIALLSPLLLKERMDRRTWLSLLIAFVGGILVSLTGGTLTAGSAPLLGSGLAVLGAVTVALYLIIGRLLRPTLRLLPYIWLVYSTAAIVLLIVVALSGLPLTGYAPTTYLWIVLMAIIPQLIGHSSFNYALGHFPAAYVSLIALAEPVGSALLAYLFLQEVPTLIQVVGAALILASVAFAGQLEDAPPDEIPA